MVRKCRVLAARAKAVRVVSTGPDARGPSAACSTLDDPCIPCALLPQYFFATEAWHERTRWVFCAESVCFKNAALACDSHPLAVDAQRNTLAYVLETMYFCPEYICRPVDGQHSPCEVLHSRCIRRWPTCRTFFKSGKGLPVRRGAGQDQPILRVMARRLASHGDWVCFCSPRSPRVS